MISLKDHGRWRIMDYGSDFLKIAIAIEEQALAGSFFHKKGTAVIYRNRDEFIVYRRIM